MNRALFVAYDFPPCENIGGSIRSEKFADYLPLFGWTPIVVSIKRLGSLKKVERYPFVFRYTSLTPFSWPYQVTPYGWALRLIPSIPLLVKKQGIDVIYVSCPPFPGAVIGAISGILCRVPVVLDFRDAWSLDPYQEGSRLKRLVYRAVFPSIEAVVFKLTTRIIVNTPSMLREYRKLYPKQFSKFFYLPNGYDQRDFVARGNNVDFGGKGFQVMHLVYTGRFGVGGRNPSNLLKALRIVADAGLPIKLTIVGDQPRYIVEKIERYGLEGIISLVPQVSHETALDIVDASDTVLLYQEESEKPVQAIAGKTFEYIASRKPILCICPPGDNRDVVMSYTAYASYANGNNPKEIAAGLTSIFSILKNTYNLEKSILKQEEYEALFERKNQAKSLAGLLRKELRIKNESA